MPKPIDTNHSFYTFSYWMILPRGQSFVPEESPRNPTVGNILHLSEHVGSASSLFRGEVPSVRCHIGVAVPFASARETYGIGISPDTRKSMKDSRCVECGFVVKQCTDGHEKCRG